MPILNSNKAIKMGKGIFNAMFGRSKAANTATKTLYRGVNAEEAQAFMKGNASSSNVSWWSDGPQTATDFIHKNGGSGYIVQADVKLNSKYNHGKYLRNDINQDTLPQRMNNYENGYGTYNGHYLQGKETWFSMHNKYLNKNMSNVKVSKL